MWQQFRGSLSDRSGQRAWGKALAPSALAKASFTFVERGYVSLQAVTFTAFEVSVCRKRPANL